MRKFMARYTLIIFLFSLASCEISSTDKKNNVVDSIKLISTSSSQNTKTVDHTALEDSVNYDNATYFIVVADTSTDYYLLNKKMFDLNKQFTIPIDTMDRFYDKTKNLIALPNNHEDEIYAGDYFPRRFPSENLSLEYLNFYQKLAGEKTIALVTGIYETEKSADSALIILQKIETRAFKIKADIYVGCVH